MGNTSKLRRDAEEIFAASLAAVDSERLVRNRLKVEGSYLSVDSHCFDLDGFDRIFVIGAGKGSGAMALGVESVLGGRIEEGIVVVKYGHAVPLKKIRTIEAGHPVPDRKSIEGGRKILNLLSGTGERDLVICLLSGGGSALMDDFPGEIRLADVQDATRILLAAGADISEMNTVRKHLSRIKGGQLVKQAFPSTLLTLVLSDVIGDDLDKIASGPTAPDPTTFSQSLEVLNRYGLIHRFPQRILDHLRAGLSGRLPETPKPGSDVFKAVVNVIVGNNRMALAAAEVRAEELEYHPLILTSSLQGEAGQVAKCLSAVAREVSGYGRPVPKPACLLAGGETTVTLTGKGRGGRNQEMALIMALELEGLDGIVFLSGGTDGTDGPTDAAGGIVDGRTCAEALKQSVDIRAMLRENDSYRFFEKMGGHLMTGPTLTNVMDIMLFLIV